MKKIRSGWMNFCHKAFGSILVMLGFSSCENGLWGDIVGGGVCMYGTPSADYTVKGTLVDEAGKPVTSASVTVRNLGPGGVYVDEYKELYNNEYMNTTVKSDAEGEYSITVNDFPRDDMVFRVVVKDEAHKADSVEVKMGAPNDDNDDAWYSGEAVKVVDFILKKEDGQN